MASRVHSPLRRDPVFADYTDLLRRRGLQVAAGVLAGLLVGIAIVGLMPKTYAATAAVEVTQTGAPVQTQAANSRTPGATVNLDTEAQLVKSGLVAGAAATRLRGAGPTGSLAAHVTVSVPADSTVLDISYAAHSPALAADGANAFARAYLAIRASQATAQIGALEAAAARRLRGLSAQEQSVTRAGKSDPAGSSRRALAAVHRHALLTQIGSLSKRITALSAITVTPGFLVQSATPPTSAQSPRLALVLTSAAMVGLLAGLLLAVAVDRRDPRLHGARTVGDTCELPVLLDTALDDRRGRPMLRDPRVRAAFGELRQTIEASFATGRGAVVVAPAGERTRPRSAATVAALLATEFARTDGSAALVHAEPPAAQLLGAADPAARADETGEPGVVGYHPAGVPGLRVVDAGALSGDPPPTRAVLELAERVGRDARFVVVSTAGWGPDVAQALAGTLGRVVLVAEDHRTARAELADADRRFASMKPQLCGMAVLGRSRRAAGGRRAPRPAPRPALMAAEGSRR